MASQFGIFTPVFETPHGYLGLLGLRASDAPETVARVKNCCQRGDPFTDVCRLLADANWRPHLVAAVAVILGGYHEEAVRLLWRRIDAGSWVTPQIGVALSMTDPEFIPRARRRLEARCPLDASELLQMTPVERHSAAGPAGSVARSAKAAQTLVQLARAHSSQTEWLDDLAAAADFQALLREDFDHSDRIADRWSQRIKAILSYNDPEAPRG
jgi:hypothetical protein